MFVFANLINAAATVLSWGLNIYMWVILARAFISWVSPDPYNPIVQFLYKTTEPVLHQVRKRLPYLGGIDISPIVVIVAIVFLKEFLVGTLREIAARLVMGAF
ncbi:MAG: YggT family protein [Deltaproteobacteria bacterium]|nr:YggT family protein [Deltaproteobacteria bacterium]